MSKYTKNEYRKKVVSVCAYFILTVLFVGNAYADAQEGNQADDHTSHHTESQVNNAIYLDLGEKQGIQKLVDAFVLRIAKDKDILPYFAKSNVDHFKQGFVEHICDLAGGPCSYKGDSMVDIHTGMKITEADFNRTVELLILAFEDVGISYPVQNKILAKLVPLRAEVIKR